MNGAKVYPRVCGGTQAICALSTPRRGLSPRVRGNPLAALQGLTQARSIPACAGEPGCGGLDVAGAGVYPRVCGGTRSRLRNAAIWDGLSPRVRGNQGRRAAGACAIGSIPACAGEPSSLTPPSRVWGVYPRVCGGTRSSAMKIGQYKGLSPRVRGNRTDGSPRTRPARSIPACAGEPSMYTRAMTSAKVYPRVCGGTCEEAQAISRESGLSPRVRGNRQVALHHHRIAGSIPACAGEPRLR